MREAIRAGKKDRNFEGKKRENVKRRGGKKVESSEMNGSEEQRTD